MEALAAIGLASNILQFVDFSAKIISGGSEIHDSLSGMTAENESLEFTTAKMKELSSKLLPQTGRETSEDEKALSRVAAECNILSDQILGLLGKHKPNDPQSRRQIAKSIFANLCSAREKLELERRLESCRAQLQLQINYLLSSETKVQFVHLLNQAQGNTDLLDKLESGMKQLQQGVQVNSLSDEAQSQMRNLLAMPEESRQAFAQQCILEALSFNDMHGRFEDVCEAHTKTFEWIFEDGKTPKLKSGRTRRLSRVEIQRSGSPRDADDDGDSTEPTEADSDILGQLERNRVSKLFTQWLSTGDGIFHVSGKLGSGKSTLMKFLCDHSRTQQELQHWAGTRKLVVAKFFFWKPGSKPQKSLHGLIRSLLHDTLQHHPELVPEVLEDTWKTVLAAPLRMPKKIELSNKQIKTAFSRLIENSNMYRNHCFCYFIDGLDEYEETTKDDCKSLVDLLRKWTEKAPGSVKLCVSSREYNVFLSAFSKEKRIRLQDLTIDDMKRYINDQLQIASHKDQEDFVAKIAEKGSGIFLWVTLVVKNLRRRLEDGHELRSLEDELNSLPEELEGLFEHLVESLPKSDRKKTYQLFAMVLELGSGALRPLAYSFLNDVAMDPDFGEREDFPYLTLSREEQYYREKKASKNINGYCKGLLVVDSAVKFTHRSVTEFLARPKTCHDMSTYLESFNAVNTVSQLLLAEIRSTCGQWNDVRLATWSSSIVQLRVKHTSDRPPFSFLECLKTSLHHQDPKHDSSLPPQLSFNSAFYLLVNGHDSFFYNQTLNKQPFLEPLHMLVTLGSWEYLEWKFHNDRELVDSACKIGVLLWHVYSYLTRFTISGREQIFPSRNTRNIPSFNPFVYLLSISISTGAEVHTSQGTSRFQHRADLTFWEHFIVYIVDLVWYVCNARPLDRPLLDLLDPDLLPFLSDSLVAFLQNDADPTISFLCSRNNDGSFEVQIEAAVSKEIKIEQFSTRKLDRITTTADRLSLRDVIMALRFENEEFLLQILDDKIRERWHKREIQCPENQMERGDDEHEHIIHKDLIETSLLDVQNFRGEEKFDSRFENSKKEDDDGQDTLMHCTEENCGSEEGIIIDEPPNAVKISFAHQETTYEPLHLRVLLSNPFTTFCLGIIIAVLILRILQ